MGTPADANPYEHTEIFNAMHRLEEIGIYRMVRPWLLSDFIFRFTAKGREEEKYRNILHQFTDQVIKMRRQALAKQQYCEDFIDQGMQNFRTSISICDTHDFNINEFVMDQDNIIEKKELIQELNSVKEKLICDCNEFSSNCTRRTKLIVRFGKYIDRMTNKTFFITGLLHLTRPDLERSWHLLNRHYTIPMNEIPLSLKWFIIQTFSCYSSYVKYARKSQMVLVHILKEGLEKLEAAKFGVHELLEIFVYINKSLTNEIWKRQKLFPRKESVNHHPDVKENSGQANFKSYNLSDKSSSSSSASSASSVTSKSSASKSQIGLHPSHTSSSKDKAYAELNDIFGDSERQPTMEDLKNMKYLENCIKEALRLFPSVPVIARKLTEDEVFGKYTLPKGSDVLVLPYVLHQDPAQFPNPESFNPDNFLPEAVKCRHPYAYIPFSAGPRNCIGQKFAVLAEKTVLSAILRKYEVRSLHSRQELIVVPNTVLVPKTGIKLQLISRSTI